jgi:hypothetical protein
MPYKVAPTVGPLATKYGTWFAGQEIRTAVPEKTLQDWLARKIIIATDRSDKVDAFTEIDPLSHLTRDELIAVINLNNLPVKVKVNSTAQVLCTAIRDTVQDVASLTLLD